MLSSRGKRTKKETLGEEHCKHARSWEEKPSGEWRCWASLPRVVPRGAERPSPRSTPTANLCQALLQLTTRTITCFLHTLSALEMSLSSKLVKCSKNLISFQSCLATPSKCKGSMNLLAWDFFTSTCKMAKGWTRQFWITKRADFRPDSFLNIQKLYIHTAHKVLNCHNIFNGCNITGFSKEPRENSKIFPACPRSYFKFNQNSTQKKYIHDIFYSGQILNSKFRFGLGPKAATFGFYLLAPKSKFCDPFKTFRARTKTKTGPSYPSWDKMLIETRTFYLPPIVTQIKTTFFSKDEKWGSKQTKSTTLRRQGNVVLQVCLFCGFPLPRVRIAVNCS